MSDKTRARQNRTVILTAAETKKFRKRLLQLNRPTTIPSILNRTIHQNIEDTLPHLPDQFADLLFLDPPYNLQKRYNGTVFQKKREEDYREWIDQWLSLMIRLLKPTASIYICCDWQTSPSVYEVARRHFIIRNRITWEREKGRGAAHNWKNCQEDIWFCTLGEQYTFHLDAVKIKRRVLAPYTHANGDPKDWLKTEEGMYRLTHPSNLWTDITVPFWSMPENTDHPTQKPEKLLAKIILASTNPGDVVFDPFLGSGTTSVTAKKLRRNYVGVELDETYCCLVEKRLSLAEKDPAIQGYFDNVFWERNTLHLQKNRRTKFTTS